MTGAGIACVSCGSRSLRVIDSRAKDNCVYRRRECKECGAKFSTAEEPVAWSVQGKGFMTKTEEIRSAAETMVQAFTQLHSLISREDGP